MRNKISYIENSDENSNHFKKILETIFSGKSLPFDVFNSQIGFFKVFDSGFNHYPTVQFIKDLILNSKDDFFFLVRGSLLDKKDLKANKYLPIVRISNEITEQEFIDFIAKPSREYDDILGGEDNIIYISSKSDWAVYTDSYWELAIAGFFNKEMSDAFDLITKGTLPELTNSEVINDTMRLMKISEGTDAFRDFEKIKKLYGN